MQQGSSQAIGWGLAIALGVTGTWQTAGAYEAGTWLVRAGAKLVDPKSDNNDTVSVEDGTQFTFDITYMVTENLGIELLAAAPFSHDITLADGGDTVASTDHLPPTLSLQYHFNSGGRFQPYVGAGINWTLFFSEDTQGALEGADLSLDDSFGLAAQVGVDFSVSDNWIVNFDLRWIDIDTDATVDGTDLGTVEIDPIVYGLNVGYRFGGR
jgi:outer membrane protein